jgi:hypothetical protein
VGESSNLLQADLSALTQPGQAFKEFVETQPLHMNLLPVQVSAAPVFTGPGGMGTATLVARIRNNGNQLTAPFTVTFYQDGALSQPIGAASIVGARGCARHEYVATTTWSNLSSGLHYFWVKVDSQDVIDERPLGEGDNVAVGFVIVDPRQVFLPVTAR